MPDHTTPEEQYTLLERLAPSGAEDFITEVFCWILQQESAGNAFLEFLKEQTQEDRNGAIVDIISDIQNGEYSWKTQKSHQISGGIKRLDMVCESGKQALIFEHKVWASLHANQLENYREVGKSKYDKFAIILITARSHQKKQDPDLHFLWRDVHKWLRYFLDQKTGNDDASLEFVYRNFLTLLEKRWLGPMPPVEDKHFTAFGYMHDAEEGIQRTKKLIREMKDRWPQILQESMKTDSGILDSPDWQDSEGRVGWNVLKSWRPGIFIGVLHNGNDHKTKLLDKETNLNTLYACVILDIERRKCPKYWNNLHYKKLVKILMEKWPYDGSKTWQFYHHIDDEDVQNPNFWHPIHIRRRLADILLNEKSGEEQADAFFESIREVVEFIVGLEAFHNLRADLSRQDANGT